MCPGHSAPLTTLQLFYECVRVHYVYASVCFYVCEFVHAHTHTHTQTHTHRHTHADTHTHTQRHRTHLKTQPQLTNCTLKCSNAIWAVKHWSNKSKACLFHIFKCHDPAMPANLHTNGLLWWRPLRVASWFR